MAQLANPRKTRNDSTGAPSCADQCVADVAETLPGRGPAPQPGVWLPLSRRMFVVAATTRGSHGPRAVPYTLRISARARYPHMTIGPETGLVVTVPAGASDESRERFMRRHQRWIAGQVDRLARIASTVPQRWPYGATLPYHGVDHRVVVVATPGRSRVVRGEDSTLTVHVRQPGIEAARRALVQWLRLEAGEVIHARVCESAQRFGICWTGLRIGSGRSRWGSCSAKGHLNFNYRLIMMPPDVLEYVVIHELMHRREFSHSARFWTLVSEHYPGYREAIRWLRTYGPYVGV